MSKVVSQLDINVSDILIKPEKIFKCCWILFDRIQMNHLLFGYSS